MDALKNYFEKLGSNFLVAAMVPSLGLVIVCILVFDPILHTSSVFQEESGLYQLIGFGLLLLIPTVIVGYTLTALNTYILKIFEGYVFFRRFPFMADAYRRKANALIIKRDALKRRIKTLKRKKGKTKKEKTLLELLEDQYYVTVEAYDQAYPPSLDDIQPTKFGNILKASEAYAGTRYGIDGVPFWPRLLHVIPLNYQQAIDSTRNELSFLVNMSVLSIIFFLLCIFAMFYTFAAPALSSNGALEFINFGYLFRYGAAGLAGLFCNWFFNRASIFSAGSFGIMIRSSYDLFRLDLLQQFRLKMPKDSTEEFYTWKNLNEFVMLGNQSLEFRSLKYDMKTNIKKG